MIKVQGRVIGITQYNSGTLTFEFYNAAGEPCELGAYTVTFMVKKSKSDTNDKAVIFKEYTDLSGQVLNVNLIPSDTTIDVGYYWWSIQLESGTYKNEVISGQFYIIDGVQD